MLDFLIEPIYTDEFTFGTYCICTLVSLALGAIIAFASSYKSHQSKSMLLTLFLLPATVQTVIMLVNGNVGTGIAVMGAFSIIRFRSVPGTAKEIVSIFLAMAAGLATAMGCLGISAFFVIIAGALIILSNYVRIPEKDDLQRELKITVPESLNYAHCFDDLFEKYTRSARLSMVKTTNMGSLYRIIYRIELKSDDSVQDFIDELRCRNGNLEISVGIPATERNEL